MGRQEGKIVQKQYPLAKNQYMREKILDESIFCANTCGACIRTRANTGKYSPHCQDYRPAFFYFSN